jgi:hypothetical protein
LKHVRDEHATLKGLVADGPPDSVTLQDVRRKTV